MDGLAWMGQIVMFVVLGLLSTPSDLFNVAGAGVVVAAVLIFVARPLATVPLLYRSAFRGGSRPSSRGSGSRAQCQSFWQRFR